MTTGQGGALGDSGRGEGDEGGGHRSLRVDGGELSTTEPIGQAPLNKKIMATVVLADRITDLRRRLARGEVDRLTELRGTLRAFWETADEIAPAAPSPAPLAAEPLGEAA